MKELATVLKLIGAAMSTGIMWGAIMNSARNINDNRLGLALCLSGVIFLVGMVFELRQAEDKDVEDLPETKPDISTERPVFNQIMLGPSDPSPNPANDCLKTYLVRYRDMYHEAKKEAEMISRVNDDLNLVNRSLSNQNEALYSKLNDRDNEIAKHQDYVTEIEAKVTELERRFENAEHNLKTADHVHELMVNLKTQDEIIKSNYRATIKMLKEDKKIDRAYIDRLLDKIPDGTDDIVLQGSNEQYIPLIKVGPLQNEIDHLIEAADCLIKRNVSRAMYITRRDNSKLYGFGHEILSIAERMKEGSKDA